MKVTKRSQVRQRGYKCPICHDVVLVYNVDPAPVACPNFVVHKDPVLLLKEWDNVINEITTSEPYTGP